VRCPSCGDTRAEHLPVIGDLDDYRCPHCGAFSVSGTDRRRIAIGEPSSFKPDRNGKVWLHPLSRTDIP
jgi:hypothetical protein